MMPKWPSRKEIVFLKEKRLKFLYEMHSQWGQNCPQKGKKENRFLKDEKNLRYYSLWPPKLNAVQQNLSSQYLISLMKENLNSMYFESLGENHENFKKA